MICMIYPRCGWLDSKAIDRSPILGFDGTEDAGSGSGVSPGFATMTAQPRVLQAIVPHATKTRNKNCTSVLGTKFLIRRVRILLAVWTRNGNIVGSS